jgi:hypothetical protein
MPLYNSYSRSTGPSLGHWAAERRKDPLGLLLWLVLGRSRRRWQHPLSVPWQMLLHCLVCYSSLPSSCWPVERRPTLPTPWRKRYVATVGFSVTAELLRLALTYYARLQNGFDPHEEQTATTQKKSVPHSLLARTRALFKRVPILGVLCGEVIFCQCLSALVTFLFLKHVKQTVTDDQERAGWTGNVSMQPSAFAITCAAALITNDVLLVSLSSAMRGLMELAGCCSSV